MKTLHVVRQYLPGTGGMETYVSCLCRHLTDLGVSADVATLDYLFKQNTSLPQHECIEGTDVIRLRSAGNPRYFLAPGIMKLLPRYDLIHVHGVDFFVDFLGTCKKIHGKPVVLSTHGGFFHTKWLAPLKQAYFRTVTRAVLYGVDRVLASSPQDERLFRQVSRRVTLVENGIDFETFSQVKKAAPGNKLIFIGRISKNKRVDRLVDTLAVLRYAVPDAELLIVGPDWEGFKSELEARASGLGLADAVEFAGRLPQEEMLDKLAGAKLFVSASEYEAFGLSTVEAMASGTIPVVNNIPAFADIIDQGKNGFLTDFSVPETAAAALASALKLPSPEFDSIAAAAKQRAARFSWPRVTKKVVKIYEEVLLKHLKQSQGKWN